MTHDFSSISLDTFASHLEWLDELFHQYQTNPNAVDPSFQALFSGKPSESTKTVSEEEPKTEEPKTSPSVLHTTELTTSTSFYNRVQALIHAYRSYGHTQAKLSPLLHGEKENLASQEELTTPELSLEFYGFSPNDLTTYQTHPLPANVLFQANAYQGLSLPNILQKLKEYYCGFIGFEFMHMDHPAEREFWREQIEKDEPHLSLTSSEKIDIYQRLLSAETFERFIHTKYLGAKRFSLEGGESVIPLLDVFLKAAAQSETKEVVLGMAHRGRLNILAHLLGKHASVIFSEFEDFAPNTVLGKSDVKYHLGYSKDYTAPDGNNIHLSLTFNPSHLEIVDPVVLGRVRAKQHHLEDAAHRKVTGILLHGDAAFMGQGVVAESFNLSQTRGYKTGGTLHVVINNQIGFTTGSQDSRSSAYCTDIAKMIGAPILHVNADHPEKVVQAAWLAAKYQSTFHKDVVIDLVCFRKYGHNETDEPSFTQPLMYQEIAEHPSVVALYGQTLLQEKVLTQQQMNEFLAEEQNRLETQLTETRSKKERPSPSSLQGVWQPYQGGAFDKTISPPTGVSQEHLQQIAQHISQIPTSFSINPKISRLLSQRELMGKGQQPLDWGMGEALAFGSLLSEGTCIRLTGQDVRRGTFSHRQSLLVDTKTGAEYLPLQKLEQGLGKKTGDFQIYDSTLSEAAVLGFEYGYSLDAPESLVLWEAQFGDFVNGAQVVLDQFLSAGEAKWSRLSGLVLLLPHGYEGQGPEHSSARIERFLQLCAEDNIQVVYPTTPAQYFHLLRRQIHRTWRKPLVVFTPKSLLRHPLAASALEEFTQGSFQNVIPDLAAVPSQIKRVVFCTGKIYYDLLEEKNRRNEKSVALVRIEQLYPLDQKAIKTLLQTYTKAKEVYLVQEEPANMGSRSFLVPRLSSLIGSLSFQQISRPEAASPATGSHKAHGIEQKQIIEQTFQT